MTTMFKLDLACLRGTWKSLVPVTLFIAAMLSFSTGAAGAVAMVAVMLPMMLMNTLFAVDVDGGWQELRLAMPLTRSQVVAGRYLTVLFAALVGALAGAAVGLGLHALRDVLEPYTHSDLGVNAWTLAGALFVSVCLSLLMQAFTLPFVMKLGFTKAVRFVPLFFTALVFALVGVAGFVVDLAGAGSFAWLTSLSAGGLTDGVLGVGSRDLSLAFIALAMAVFTAACLAVSYAVARHLYERRAF